MGVAKDVIQPTQNITAGNLNAGMLQNKVANKTRRRYWLVVRILTTCDIYDLAYSLCHISSKTLSHQLPMKDILRFAYGSIAAGSCLFLMAILSMISRPTRWKPWPILRLIILIIPALGTGLISILWFTSPSEELDTYHLCCLHRCSHSHPYWR